MTPKTKAESQEIAVPARYQITGPSVDQSATILASSIVTMPDGRVILYHEQQIVAVLAAGVSVVRIGE